MKIFNSEIILHRLSKLHPKIIDLSLDRVINLLCKLDNPERKIPPVIHIAGTNGKGSTLAFIKAGLEAENKVVHTYTSPHLVKFNERINISGATISDSLLSRYLERCEIKNKNNNITFFEITTCAAFLAFSENPADYTLLEVGLGGRLDATNVIERPVISIITPISIDHEQFLGNSLNKIAREKAGILKKDTLGIIAKQDKKALTIIKERAKNLGAALLTSGEDWVCFKNNNKLIYEDHSTKIELPAPALFGPHQYENAGVAITALKCLKFNKNTLQASLTNVNWPARLQKINFGPIINQINQPRSKFEVWVDGGHNEAAGNAIADFLQCSYPGSTHLICGMINSKNPLAFLKPMKNRVSSITGIKIPNENASLSAKHIYQAAKLICSNAFVSETIEDAVSTVLFNKKSNSNFRIIFCGSLYLAGQILQHHR